MPSTGTSTPPRDTRLTPAISDTGRDAGRLLAITLGIAYASTLFAGYFAYGVSHLTFPQILEQGALNKTAVKAFPAYFSLKIPPLMDVTTALVTAFIFGLGMEAVQAEPLRRLVAEHEQQIVFACSNRFGKRLLQIFGKNDFLWFHSPMYFAIV